MNPLIKRCRLSRVISGFLCCVFNRSNTAMILDQICDSITPSPSMINKFDLQMKVVVETEIIDISILPDNHHSQRPNDSMIRIEFKCVEKGPDARKVFISFLLQNALILRRTMKVFERSFEFGQDELIDIKNIEAYQIALKKIEVIEKMNNSFPDKN